MADLEKKVWGIHATDDDLFLQQNRIAIGWREIGDLTKLPDNRDAIKAKYAEVFPNEKKGAIPVATGMLYRFCYEVQIGDYVVFPSKSDRMVNIGRITGNYEYVDNEHYPHVHSVKWLKHIPRTSFSQGALYEIGAIMTFFSIKNYADEFLSALTGHPPVIEGGGDDPPVMTPDSILDTTRDYILKELSRNLKGYALEDFVANLLQAMGYRTAVSPQGGDSGIDITAYKDELPPRILVQVKSVDGDIKEQTIMALKGAMMPGDYGLFVTLSNYTKNAKKYLDANPIIRGIDGNDLVELILKYYEALDDKYQRIIPLKKVYVPVPKEDTLDESLSSDISQNKVVPDGIYSLERKIMKWNKKKVKATVVVKGEYWVVQPGSIISPIDGQGLSSSLRNTRKSANIKDNVLQEEVTFTSPSLAAGFVTGHSTDGCENWRDKDGDLIDEYRQK